MKNKKRKEDHTLPILVLRETFLVLKSDYNFVKCLRIVLSNTYCVVLCFCFVFLRLVYPMLSVSLCFSSSCVPYAASFSVFLFCFSCLVYPMLPVSLDCPFVIVPSVFSNIYSVLTYIINVPRRSNKGYCF